jgi:hypothetical protein
LLTVRGPTVLVELVALGAGEEEQLVLDDGPAQLRGQVDQLADLVHLGQVRVLATASAGALELAKLLLV